jgi:hypothetical protein
MSKEFDKFDETIKHLLQIPHSKIKSKLDEEKAAKKRKKSKTSSASGRV